MTDITIPREAIEALQDTLRLSRLWADPATARAACLAMLRNWPGMYVPKVEREPLIPTRRSTRKQVAIDWPAIILPLTENTNDKD